MNYTISISGMGCAKCEQRIQKALMQVDGVLAASVSAASGNAIVTADNTVTAPMLTDAISAAGAYTVLDIQQEASCCSGKHKHRSDKEQRDLMNRLKRIEGQVRGVEGMLENDAYCTDILTQVAAINAALNSFNKVLLGNHIRSCVAENIRTGNDEIIDELVAIMQKLMK